MSAPSATGITLAAGKRARPDLVSPADFIMAGLEISSIFLKFQVPGTNQTYFEKFGFFG
jgi:hypothetical protein